jgi:hypothetical protein
MDYPMWTGLSGNALDFIYESSSSTNSTLNQFSQICVAAAQMNPNACPFAAKSMTASSPANDIISRITAIVTKLSQIQGVNDTKGDSFYLLNVNQLILDDLSDPDAWYFLSNTFLAIEDLVHSSSSSRVKRDEPTLSSLNYSSYNWSDMEWGLYNDFRYTALLCLENNYTGILTQSSFISYIDEYISEDLLRGYNTQMFFAASCFTWPNLAIASGDIERFNDTFPNMTNRILLLAPIYSPQFSLDGVLSTYNFLGSENANILLHNGFGDGYTTDPNNCTVNAATQFLTQGKYTLSILADIRNDTTEWNDLYHGPFRGK